MKRQQTEYVIKDFKKKSGLYIFSTPVWLKEMMGLNLKILQPFVC